MTETASPFLERTVHLITYRGPERHSLSGFVIADGIVLTCGHDVVDADQIEVRPYSNGDQLLRAEIAWRPEPEASLDVAVLTVPGLDTAIHSVVGWGEIRGFVGAIEAFGLGYPAANRVGDRDSPSGGFHVARIRGVIVPEEGHERGRMVFEFEPGQLPDDANWGGASGMAVFDQAQHLLLGVVSERLSGWHNRWDLTPVSSVRNATGIPDRLRHLPIRPAGESQSLIEPAYFRHPGLSSDFKLLTARYGQVPYVRSSNRAELDQLIDWCTRLEDQISISEVFPATHAAL